MGGLDKASVAEAHVAWQRERVTPAARAMSIVDTNLIMIKCMKIIMYAYQILMQDNVSTA